MVQMHRKWQGSPFFPYGLARTVMPCWIPCPSFFSMEGAPLQTQPSYKRMTTDHLAVPSPVRHVAFRETTRLRAYCKYYNNFISMHLAGNRSPILSFSVVIGKSLLTVCHCLNFVSLANKFACRQQEPPQKLKQLLN